MIHPQENQNRRRLRIGALAAFLLLSTVLIHKMFFAEPELDKASASTTTETTNEIPQKEFIIPSIEMPLKWVPPSQSIIGAMNADNVDASPPLPVETTYGFWMGTYEVAQLQYVNLMGTNPSYFKSRS